MDAMRDDPTTTQSTPARTSALKREYAMINRLKNVHCPVYRKHRNANNSPRTGNNISCKVRPIISIAQHSLGSCKERLTVLRHRNPMQGTSDHLHCSTLLRKLQRTLDSSAAPKPHTPHIARRHNLLLAAAALAIWHVVNWPLDTTAQQTPSELALLPAVVPFL